MDYLAIKNVLKCNVLECFDDFSLIHTVSFLYYENDHNVAIIKELETENFLYVLIVDKRREQHDGINRKAGTFITMPKANFTFKINRESFRINPNLAFSEAIFERNGHDLNECSDCKGKRFFIAGSELLISSSGIDVDF